MGRVLKRGLNGLVVLEVGVGRKEGESEGWNESFAVVTESLEWLRVVGRSGGVRGVVVLVERFEEVELGVGGGGLELVIHRVLLLMLLLLELELLLLLRLLVDLLLKAR